MNERSMQEFVVKTLVEEFGFSTEHARDAFDRLARQPSILGALHSWLKDRGSLPTIECEGFSLFQLVHTFGMKPVGAFLTLVWLLEDPVEAKTALAHGFDRVSGLKE